MKRSEPTYTRKLITGSWWVATGGYRIESGLFQHGDQLISALQFDRKFDWELRSLENDPDATTWIVANSSDWAVVPFEETRQYDPFEFPDLHRTFAALRPDPEKLREFADQFGFLGREIRLLSVEPNIGDHLHGESVGLWLDELLLLASLVKLWDLLAEKTASTQQTLTEMISLEADLLRFSDPKGLFGAIGWSSAVLRLLPDPLTPKIDYQRNDIGSFLWRRSDYQSLSVGMLARLLLRKGINNGLAHGCSPAVDIVPGYPLTVIPRSLLGAMYASFALEVTGQTSPRLLCPACGRSFVVQHGKQIYCSENCKFRAYRHRKKTQGESNAKSNQKRK